MIQSSLLAERIQPGDLFVQAIKNLHGKIHGMPDSPEKEKLLLEIRSLEVTQSIFLPESNQAQQTVVPENDTSLRDSDTLSTKSQKSNQAPQINNTNETSSPICYEGGTAECQTSPPEIKETSISAGKESTTTENQTPSVKTDDHDEMNQKNKDNKEFNNNDNQNTRNTANENERKRSADEEHFTDNRPPEKQQK